jgi:hypothetical protein
MAVRSGLEAQLETENPSEKFDFESVLDECGFGYKQSLPGLSSGNTLWQVIFD